MKNKDTIYKILTIILIVINIFIWKYAVDVWSSIKFPDTEDSEYVPPIYYWAPLIK